MNPRQMWQTVLEQIQRHPDNDQLKQALKHLEAAIGFIDMNRLEYAEQAVNLAQRSYDAAMRQVQSENQEMFPDIRNGKYLVENIADRRQCGHIHDKYWEAVMCALRLDASGKLWRVRRAKPSK